MNDIIKNSENSVHYRCLSHNTSYKHSDVHPILQQSNILHERLDILTLEIVFHVLSPLPGLEKSSTD